MPIFRIQKYATNDLTSVFNLSQLSKNNIKGLHQQQVTKDMYNNAFPSAMKKMKLCNMHKELVIIPISYGMSQILTCPPSTVFSFIK